MDLTAAAHRAAKGYSTGMRQRLGIALALLADPPTLILDEPVNGLDPAGIVEIRDLVLALASGGRTILISSHLLTEVEKTCDRVTIVDHGRIVAAGHAQRPRRWRRADRGATPAAPADVAAARRALEAAGFAGRRWTTPYPTALWVGGAPDGAVDRAGPWPRSAIFPDELIRRRDSLEDVFLRLTGGGNGDDDAVRRLLAAEWVRFGRRRDLWLLVALVPVIMGVLFVMEFNALTTPPVTDFVMDPPDPVLEAEYEAQALAEWRSAARRPSWRPSPSRPACSRSAATSSRPSCWRSTSRSPWRPASSSGARSAPST